MGKRVTITLDEDVAARVRRVSQLRDATLSDTVNGLLRATLRTPAFHMGFRADLNYDCIAALIEQAEGPLHG